MSAPQSPQRSIGHEILEARRRNKRPGMLQGSATLGGPQAVQGAQQTRQQALGLQSPGAVPEAVTETVEAARGASPTSALGVVAEVGASLAGTGVGGAVARKAAGGALKAATPFVKAATEWLGRTVGSGVGGLVGSEALAGLGPPESPENAAFRRAESAAVNVLGEAVSPVFKPFTGLLMRPFKRRLLGVVEERMTAGAVEAQQVVVDALNEAGVNMGATLTPGLLRTGWPNTLEKIAEVGFGSGRSIEGTRRHAGRAALSTLRRIMEEFGETLGPDDLGKVVDDAVDGGSKIARAYTRGAYEAVDRKILEVGGREAVNITPVFGEMHAKLNTAAAAKDAKALGILSLLDEFSNKPVGFSQAESIRQALLSMARPTVGDLLPDVRRLAGYAAGLVDDQIKTASLRVGVLGQEVLDLYDVARRASRTSHEVFGNEALGQVLNKASAEEIAESLFKAGRPTRVKAVRDIIYNPDYAGALGGRTPDEVWGTVQSSYLGTLVSKAGSTRPGKIGYGTLSGKKLRTAMEGAGGTFDEVFPDPTQRAGILATARALELSQSKPAGRSFQIFVQLTQAGAAVRTAQWALGFQAFGVGPAGKAQQTVNFTILAAPAVIGMVLSRRSVANALLNSVRFQEQRAGRLGASVIGQSAARAVRDLRDTGIPFTFRDNNTGEEFEVPAGTGPAAEPAGPKPRSKF